NWFLDRLDKERLFLLRLEAGSVFLRFPALGIIVGSHSLIGIIEHTPHDLEARYFRRARARTGLGFLGRLLVVLPRGFVFFILAAVDGLFLASVGGFFVFLVLILVFLVQVVFFVLLLLALRRFVGFVLGPLFHPVHCASCHGSSLVSGVTREGVPPPTSQIR